MKTSVTETKNIPNKKLIFVKGVPFKDWVDYLETDEQIAALANTMVKIGEKMIENKRKK